MVSPVAGTATVGRLTIGYNPRSSADLWPWEVSDASGKVLVAQATAEAAIAEAHVITNAENRKAEDDGYRALYLRGEIAREMERVSDPERLWAALDVLRRAR